MKNKKIRKKDLPKLRSEYRKKKRRKKIIKMVWIFIVVISLIALSFASYQLCVWNRENKETNVQEDEIDKMVKIDEVKDDKSVKNVNPPGKENKDSDYWKYIKLPLISVDFTELLKKNSDTVAYLKVNGTNINYPVVQTKDNKYYLTHSYDKSINSAGWVFMDYRNDVSNLQDNTIIYAHGRVNTTMFGSLKNILKSNWYKDTDNYTVYLSSPKENTLWQVISVYQIPTETYYIISSFGTNESKQKWIDTILSRSAYNFNADVSVNDKFLTLSTCANKTDKVVLHARLIKQQTVS